MIQRQLDLRHTRMRVLGPEEERPQEGFYEREDGEAGMMPKNMTAFRAAERYFKAKNHTLDLSESLDMAKPEAHPRVRPIGTLKEGREGERLLFRTDGPILMYEVQGVPGLRLLPQVLNPEQQAFWITRALSHYMQPPNLTNLDAHYEIPPQGLWKDYVGGEGRLQVQRKPSPDDGPKRRGLPLELLLDRPAVVEMMRRIRWATLGYHYDWSSKQYNFDSTPVDFPPELACWSDALCRAAGFGAFQAEAAIVNFYQIGDSLTGHVDRSERNMQVPLLSLSLGASCIFLMGGLTRDDPVLPIILHSGDVLILSGEARRCFHGVPRILPYPTPAHLHSMLMGGKETWHSEWCHALEMLGSGRININIRQVTR